MLGVFLASLWLSAAVAGTTLLSDDGGDAPGVGPTGSLRFWTLCGVGFGLAGMPLTALSVAPLVTLGVAAATGAALGRLLWPLFAESTAEVSLLALSGQEGRVVLPVSRRNGKIVIQTDARRVELPARSDDGATLAVGRRVLVAFIEDGVACVIGC